ncbi:MAG: hypothetical protein GY866_28265 [Proteobacteria bacterium]|nr:hypothetical protein [Pseudomonadota bacterium]
MTKKKLVLNHLRSFKESGSKSIDDVLALEVKNLKTMSELEGIGKTTLSDALNDFKNEIQIEQSKSNSDINSTIDEDLRDFLERLHNKEDILFHLLQEHEAKKKQKEAELSKDGVSLVKARIQQQYPMVIPRHDSGQAIGVRIDSEIFKEFQELTKKMGLSQRHAIHLSLRLFVEYAGKMLEECGEEDEH